jgi:NAD(P)-dependent dehydrogenase (short-subunit alcohol dehydrogenase family)
MARLNGRVAIVTGGARSIGAAFAKGLAAEGAKVVVADLEPADETLGVIKQFGGDAMSVVTDVTNESSCEEMTAKTIEAFGRLDILVANAGLWVHLERQAATDIDVSDWENVMSVNVKGVWLSAKAAIPGMLKNEYGKIITVTSTRAMKGGANMLHYDTSKGAVIGMTRSLAREYGPMGIRANAIAPGATDTEISQALADETQKVRRVASARARAIKRAEEPDDLVGACVHLASPESDFMSGQTMVVDGGAIVW